MSFSAAARIDYCAAEARGLLLDHRSIEAAIADALIARRTLDGAEVDQVIERSHSKVEAAARR